jgi:serine/threonine-protein kinase
LERELGGGGMSRVFVAEETALGRKVVIKVLPPETAAQVSLERFKREILLAAKLQHPHIVPLLSAGVSDGLPYFTMPFVEGESLRVRLARHGELPVNDAIRILREIASALAYAHEHGIVHRDIKPDNVLLSGGSAMVTDFGVAKALSASSNAELGGGTSIGVALGTPAYMAPEQATADPAIDHRADIYAFGVLAYELLTGQPPFAGRTPQNLLAAHVTEAPEAISRRRASLPPALAALVMRCLEKRPADRPQSAGEIVHALDDITTPSGGTTPTGTQPLAAVITDGARPARTMLVAAVVLLAAAGIAIAYARKGGSTAPDRLTVSAEKPLWIAVLPPVFSGRAEDDWFGDGLADEMRGALVKIPGLQVKGSRSSQSFKGTTKTIPEIAKALGVDYVVVSSVRWSPTSAGAGRVYFAPELVDARTDAVRWRSPYDTTVTDLATGQRAIAEHAARDLAGAFSTSVAVSRTRASATPNVKPEAYAAYQSGKQALLAFAPSSKTRSFDLLRRAIARDSTFAKAHALLAISIGWFDGDTLIRQRAVQRAIALAPDDPDVLAAAAEDRLFAWDWSGARADLSRALASDPNNFWALADAMALEAALGNVERSVELGKRAAEVDPVSAGDAYPQALFTAGRMEEALAAARAGLAGDSLSVANPWHERVAEVLAWRGDFAGARAQLERQAALTGAMDSVSLSLWETGALARGGRAKEARARLEQLRTAVLRQPHGSPGVYRLAGVFASLGEADSAFAWLDLGLARRGFPLGSFGIPNNPYLAPLHSDPRYHALLRRTGFRP